LKESFSGIVEIDMRENTRTTRGLAKVKKEER